MKITFKRIRKMERINSPVDRVVNKIKKSHLCDQKARKQTRKRIGNAYGE